MNDCPTEERLQALLSRSLTAPEEEALEEHLAGCVGCEERLRQLTSDSAAERWRRLQVESCSAGRETPVAGQVKGTGPWTSGREGAGEDMPDVPERIGRFAVSQLLGEGSFGRVYRAYDEQLEREVAIKVAKAERLNEPQQVERFLREARAAGRLKHPHIVRVFEAGHDGTSYYIASECISGQTLAAALAAGRLDFSRTAQIMRALAEALGYAHEQGIVHRDVKPANVMLDDKGQPLLMDFGLAMRLDKAENLTHQGTILGTALYMAPEQAEGQTDKVGPASDQYSLGVMLYEMLCSRIPFRGGYYEVLTKQAVEEPPPLHRSGSRIPRDLETICMSSVFYLLFYRLHYTQSTHDATL